MRLPVTRPAPSSRIADRAARPSGRWYLGALMSVMVLLGLPAVAAWHVLGHHGHHGSGITGSGIADKGRVAGLVERPHADRAGSQSAGLHSSGSRSEGGHVGSCRAADHSHPGEGTEPDFPEREPTDPFGCRVCTELLAAKIIGGVLPAVDSPRTKPIACQGTLSEGLREPGAQRWSSACPRGPPHA